MPLIFSIDRSRHAPRPTIPIGAAGAVITDGTEPGERVSFHLAILKDGQLVPIRHPIEDHDLREHGETHGSATAKGILFIVEPHLCRNCGSTVHVPHIRYSIKGGCYISIVVAIVISILSAVMFGTAVITSVWIAFFSLVAILSLLEVISSFVAKRKFHSNIAAVSVGSCPNCGHLSLAKISRIGRRGLVLPDGSVVNVRSVGVS